MASKTSPEEQVKFLIACIKFKEGDKINFDAVAKECNIVTKAAAAKRYERLLKSINESKDKEAKEAKEAKEGEGNEDEGGTPPAPTPKPATTPRKPRTKKAPAAKTTASPAKKRKLEVKKEDDEANDEVETGEATPKSIFGRDGESATPTEMGV